MTGGPCLRGSSRKRGDSVLCCLSNAPGVHPRQGVRCCHTHTSSGYTVPQSMHLNPQGPNRDLVPSTPTEIRGFEQRAEELTKNLGCVWGGFVRPSEITELGIGKRRRRAGRTSIG